ncbi:MAG: ABC transporter permease [Candidatus Thorarchaeota archaeon]
MGFWKEFRRHKIGFVGLAILVFYVGMAFSAPYLATHDPKINNKVAPTFRAPSWASVFDPEGVTSGQYMPDPYFYEEPEFTVEGTNTDEFDYRHEPSSGPNQSKVELRWDHTPGSMDWPTPLPLDTKNGPACNDYVYFTQSIDWPFNKIPGGVNMTFDFAVELTGDFAEKDEGGLMFKVFLYLVDSSDNWWRIYQSYPPYNPNLQSRRVSLSYWDMLEGWGGMVEEEGSQEDPTDELTVACVLAPTKRFLSYGGESPQDDYTGSVNLTVTRMSMYVYGEYFGILGTTDKGADAWSQLVFGSRVSLIVGILATALSTAVGVIVGLVAGYFGGKVDESLMRVVDFLLVIPSLPLMMVLAAFLGRDIWNIIVVIAILGWTGTSRLIRSQVLAEKNKAYVESARAIGASDTYIMFRHILPNVTPILFANITLGVVGAILSESGLAFLGLTDPSLASWGRMLADAQSAGAFANGAWWLVIFPGMAITTLSLAFTFVGHTMDQVLNPKLRER